MTYNYAFDTKNYRQDILDFPIQCEKALHLADNIQITQKVNKIAVLGMGGSALPGEILSNYFSQYPFEVIISKEYDVPARVDKQTLIFIISYSGNTEETIAAYRKISKVGAPIVVVTSGGKLEQLVPMYQSQLIKVPTGLQPRVAIGYMTIPLIKVAHVAGLIPDKTLELRNAIQALRKPLFEEYGKELAQKIGEKIPLIYASPKLSSIAYKWKISFNENAKSMAFCNTIPEMNHNELCGYTHANSRFFTIMIKDVVEDPRIKKRMEIIKDLLKKMNNDAVEIAIKGDDLFSKILTTIYVGDWVSYYYAISKGIDPAPVELIEQFKQQMK
jgi:glucose/mannose-6-phosphate isomerase